MTLSDENILFGIVNNPDLTHEENLYLNRLILIAKMCISKYRYGIPINLCIMLERELMLRGLLKYWMCVTKILAYSLDWNVMSVELVTNPHVMMCSFNIKDLRFACTFDTLRLSSHKVVLS